MRQGQTQSSLAERELGKLINEAITDQIPKLYYIILVGYRLKENIFDIPSILSIFFFLSQNEGTSYFFKFRYKRYTE